MTDEDSLLREARRYVLATSADDDPETQRHSIVPLVAKLIVEVELWKDRAAALQRDFDATLQAPCPHCGERP